MALVSFTSLCIDVSDEAGMARFWSAAAGLDVATHTDGDPILTGPTPQHTIWLNDVPEPKTVKHRVHLDVNGGSVAEYEAMGARVLADWGPFAWTVMADPEGGEFCLFERDRPPVPRHREVPPRWDHAYRLYELCVDAADSRAIASWWADVFGATLRDSDRQFFWIEDLAGCPFGSFVFLDVPEPKTVKNRIHWDVTLVGAATIDDLAAKGATVLRAQDDEIDWTVMADPEGNEFCVFEH
ncbi:MAG: VOC family protein [Actinomycetota bacterium]|nr:VOC family protein [Actinomycetota bacterium]